MSTFEIPLDSVPNQKVSTTLNGETWTIVLETRKGHLYISLTSRTRGDVLLNRVCLDRTVLGYGFVFVDVDGTTDPVYTGLGGRYVLVWSDGL